MALALTWLRSRKSWNEHPAGEGSERGVEVCDSTSSEYAGEETRLEDPQKNWRTDACHIAQTTKEEELAVMDPKVKEANTVVKHYGIRASVLGRLAERRQRRLEHRILKADPRKEQKEVSKCVASSQC